MFLMYVDESGDAGLVGSPTRYFVLTGLVVHELSLGASRGAAIARAPMIGRLVASVLGRGTTEVRADTSRYVDITVLLGADWTPPAKALYP